MSLDGSKSSKMLSSGSFSVAEPFGYLKTPSTGVGLPEPDDLPEEPSYGVPLDVCTSGYGAAVRGQLESSSYHCVRTSISLTDFGGRPGPCRSCPGVKSHEQVGGGVRSVFGSINIRP